MASAVIFIRQNDSRTQLIVFFRQAFNRFLIFEEIVDGNVSSEIFIHLLDLTRNSCEK